MHQPESQRTVLVIDDEPENLRVAVDLLTAYSFQVRTARDGETGLRRARAGRPDLILLDVQMPGIDGFETCKRLKADPELVDIPVIFLTARIGPEATVRAMEVGAVDFVGKPVDPNELLARVRTHLELRALQQTLERQNAQLEQRIAEQTTDLRQELEWRTQADQQREHLLGLVRTQGDELRSLTRRWLQDVEARDAHLASSLQDHVIARLLLVESHLGQAQELVFAGREIAVDLASGQEHLEIARSLLAPVLAGSVEIKDSLVQPTRRVPHDDPLIDLSTREYEVLQLLSEGKANKEIAWVLGVAPTTVSTYRKRIMDKLGVDDLASLIRLLLQREASAGS